MLARSLQLARKAEAALISAIDVYNKPDFAYREETFCILALNAWELLLKAKIVADNHNDPRALYVYERRRTKSGGWSSRLYVKRNRAGNPHTMGLGQLITHLDQNPSTRLPTEIQRNLIALTEIRDNAVHYMNTGPQLAKYVLEIGTASVRNFIELARRWLALDLSRYSLYLMPIGFVSAPGSATALLSSQDEGKLINYLSTLIKGSNDDRTGTFHVALEVNISMKRSSVEAVSTVVVTNDPRAPEIQLTEEDIRRTYPWDYRELTERLRRRYVNFKCNSGYHGIRKGLMSDKRFVQRRLLDPGNPKSLKKDFYNPNIVQEFDKFYSRR